MEFCDVLNGDASHFREDFIGCALVLCEFLLNALTRKTGSHKRPEVDLALEAVRENEKLDRLLVNVSPSFI